MPALYRVARLIPSVSAATGRDLFAPLAIIDNGEILVENGRIIAAGRNLPLPCGCEIHDLGEVTILPPLVNCHTHLQLSWLAGKTLWHEGFVPWLASMVPQLLAAKGKFEGEAALVQAIRAIAASGTGLVGDVGGTIPGALSRVDLEAQKAGIDIRHFCEWFGFATPGRMPWPERCRRELAEGGSALQRCAPAGHALYSTSGTVLQAAHTWCRQNSRVFSLHLAESPQESEMLESGTGPLADFYRPGVLPQHWSPPGVRPFQYAAQLGLLGPGTLAVHGVTLNRGELRELAATGSALCICARSNRNLGVGQPPLRDAIEAGCLLCLGTDGLSSCEDLDLRNEIRYLCENLDIPLQVLARLATANGAVALGNMAADSSLAPGRPARFSVLKNG